MDSFDDSYYVPLLLTKRGERRAIESLDPSVGRMLRPLFIVPPVDWDYENDVPAKSETAHLAGLPTQLSNTWGTEDAFLDLNFLSDAPLDGGQHPLTWFHNAAAAEGLALTPVVTFDSTPDYIAAVAAIVAAGGDVCIRAQQPHWGPAIQMPLDEILADLTTTAPNAHFVLDLEDDVGASTGIQAAAELTNLPYALDWKSVTLASTAIPVDMPAGPGMHTITRQDWTIYTAVRTMAATLPRVPSFGDYSINGVGIGPGIDPRVLNISATLRYTVDSEWLVSKGGLWKGNGGKSLGASSVPPAALALTTHPDYAGAGHCDYEDWLTPVSTGVGGSNPEAWRRYGTRHHLHFVTEQLATVVAGAAGP